MRDLAGYTNFHYIVGYELYPTLNMWYVIRVERGHFSWMKTPDLDSRINKFGQIELENVRLNYQTRQHKYYRMIKHNCECCLRIYSSDVVLGIRRWGR